MRLLFLIIFTIISSFSFGQSIHGKWTNADSSVKLDIRKKRIIFDMSYKNGTSDKQAFRFKKKSRNRLKIMDDYITAGMFFGLTKNKLACFKVVWLTEDKFKLEWIDEKKSDYAFRDMLYKGKLIFQRQ